MNWNDFRYRSSSGRLSEQTWEVEQRLVNSAARSWRLEETTLCSVVVVLAMTCENAVQVADGWPEQPARPSSVAYLAVQC